MSECNHILKSVSTEIYPKLYEIKNDFDTEKKYKRYYYEVFECLACGKKINGQVTGYFIYNNFSNSNCSA